MSEDKQHAETLGSSVGSVDFEVGDLIEASGGYVLACGSGVYRRAVLVSVDPFVAVSESGDMLWRATIGPDKVCRIGKALPKSLDNAVKRWLSGPHNV